MKILKSLLLCLILFTSCKKKSSIETPIVEPPVKQDSIPTTKYNLAFIGNCILFNSSPIVTNLANQGYTELSGIAASQKNAGILYMHEDGSIKNIALTNINGDDLGIISLSGISFSDVEDIAVGAGPLDNTSYIYLADIGDNNFKRSFVTIYRFQEPEITYPNTKTIIQVSQYEKLKFSYSRGPANAETLMVDPLTKSLFILTKENSKSVVYVADYPQSSSNTTLLKAKAILNLDLLTAGDISPDGSEILLRDKDQIWYWKRSDNESILQTLLKEPQYAPYAVNEKQGEGICFTNNADGYITNTETKSHPEQVSTLSFYQRKK